MPDCARASGRPDERRFGNVRLGEAVRGCRSLPGARDRPEASERNRRPCARHALEMRHLEQGSRREDHCSQSYCSGSRSFHAGCDCCREACSRPDRTDKFRSHGQGSLRQTALSRCRQERRATPTHTRRSSRSAGALRPNALIEIRSPHAPAQAAPCCRRRAETSLPETPLPAQIARDIPRGARVIQSPFMDGRSVELQNFRLANARTPAPGMSTSFLV
jgi:hypothetical protein